MGLAWLIVGGWVWGCGCGDLQRFSGVAVGEGAALVGEDGFDVAGEVWAGAVEVAGAVVPDFGDELGVDDSFDVRLPDVPDAPVEDSELDEGVFVGEEIEVFADRDGGLEVALPVGVEALIGFESAELDQGRVALGQREEDLGVEGLFVGFGASQVREDGAEGSGYDRARGDDLEQKRERHGIGPSAELWLDC